MNDQTKKRPSEHLDVPIRTSAAVSEPLQDVVSPVQGGSVFEMQTGLFNLGFNRARQSGTTEARDEDTAALTDNARAMARQTFRDKFDPSANTHDAMHHAEYERLFGQRKDAEITEQHAAVNARETERALALAPKAGVRPEAQPLLVAGFTAAISVTIAPTLHDLLPAKDDLLAWFFAMLISLLVGFTITWAILSGRRAKLEWVGVIAGIGLGIGLCIVRLTAASDAGGVGIAIGLTVIEIALVLLAEWIGSGLRARDAEWLTKHNAEAQATAARDAASGELARWKAKINELDEAIAAKIALVEDRHNRNIQLPELEAVAIKAVIDGYNAGLTENIGELRGVRHLTRRSA